MTAQLLIGLGAGIIAIVLFLYRWRHPRPRRHWLYFIDLTGGRSAMIDHI